MKIAWFSPLVPEHTEVANHTERLRDELMAKHSVRFFTEKTEGFFEPAADRWFPADPGQAAPEMLHALNEVELVVYNLGNHPGFFTRTWFLSQVKPGIVILHDLKLHHFYAGIYRIQLEDRSGYLAALRQHYGRLGHEAGVAYWRQQVSIDFMAQHFPMTRWAVGNALALVVHTPHALETVRQLTTTPARMISLAHAPRAAERPLRPASDVEVDGSFTRERNVRVILFGYLNVNRRIVEFISALAAMPERERFDVHLMGTVRNQPEVESAIEALGLRERVILYGYVAEPEFVAALDQADLAVNLRYPTMGEASASQLRIWDHALPSLVTYTEGYTALPFDTVFFVHPETEQADIQRHLRHFLHRPQDFDRAGELGRQWLLAHHRPSMYVDQLDELFVELEALRSRHSQLALAERVGTASARWINLVPVIDRERFYAGMISEMV